LIPGIRHQAELILSTTSQRFLGGAPLLVPSYDATATDMDPQLYWRGPAWFNMNWMMIIALAQAGETVLADDLATRSLRLARDNDFPEYVNPWTGTPHGTRQFSWTAALALDLEVDSAHEFL
jgi:glycogen debranching enzyme